MANSISYRIIVGPRNDMFGVEPSGPSNAILVLDNQSSDFQLSKVVQDDDSGYAKRIYETSSSTRRTKILSNTSDVKMTDVVDIEGKPLFFKIRKDRIRGATVLINGEEPEYFDSNFIYVRSKDATIEYRSSQGDTIFKRDAESVPVFLWEGALNHADLIEMDGRTFSYRGDKGQVLITASKPNVISEVVPEPVFTIEKIRNHTISLKPFLVRSLRAGSNERSIIEYNYLNVIADIRSRTYEQVKFDNKDYLELENNNVIRDSVTIYKMSGINKIVLFDNNSSQSGVSINSSKGRIYAKTLLEDSIISESEVILADYRYMEDELSCTYRDHYSSAGGNVVHFQICPTRVKSNGFDLKYGSKISYTLTDLDGKILETNDDNVVINTLNINYELGFGELGFGEEGYGGIRSDFSNITINMYKYRNGIVGSTVGSSGLIETGWGDLGYGMGPFGGTTLDNISKVKNLLDIRNDSKKACISIGSIEYSPSYSYVEIHESAMVSKRKLFGGQRELNRNSGIIWSASINEEYINAHSLADHLKTKASIHFEGNKEYVSGPDVTIEFNIKDLSSSFTPSGEVDPALMLSSSVSADAMSVVDSHQIEEVDNLITGLMIFEMVNLTPVPRPAIPVLISADLTTAHSVIQKNSSTEETRIGLGYKDSSLEVPPTKFIKL